VGCRLELWINVNNGNSTSLLTIAESIKLPSTAAYTPYLVLDDGMYIIEMRKRQTDWIIVSMSGAFKSTP
jgi:hypothetical protein